MSYQFIIISSSEKRKQKMMNLFKQLDISDNLIYYLEASTPQNSEEYFIDSSITNNSDKKIICCAKSHFRAIEYASRDEAPEFSIILEDDAAFHKIYFLKVIEEIISNWKQHFNHCHYISLGWIPCNNYKHYTTNQNMVIKSITDIDNNIRFFNNFRNVGCQCYMVKKSKIVDISLLLNQKTYNIFVDKINSHMKKIYKEPVNYSVEAVDCLLNRLMSFYIIFPPLAIEQKDAISTLGHNNYNDYWIKFFKGYEEEIKNYITY